MKIVIIYPTESDKNIVENFPGFVCKNTGEFHVTAWYKTGYVTLNELTLLCALFVSSEYAIHIIK